MFSHIVDFGSHRVMNTGRKEGKKEKGGINNEQAISKFEDTMQFYMPTSYITTEFKLIYKHGFVVYGCICSWDWHFRQRDCKVGFPQDNWSFTTLNITNLLSEVYLAATTRRYAMFNRNTKQIKYEIRRDTAHISKI